MTDVLRPDMKVVCVPIRWRPAHPSWRDSGMAYPVPGFVYTVREVLDWHFPNGLLPAVRLVEIVNPIIHWTSGNVDEVAWGAKNFRPIEAGEMTADEMRELVLKISSARDDEDETIPGEMAEAL